MFSVALSASSSDAQISRQSGPRSFKDVSTIVSKQSQNGLKLAKAESGMPKLMLGTGMGAPAIARPSEKTPQQIAHASLEVFKSITMGGGFVPQQAVLEAATPVTAGNVMNTAITMSYAGIPVRDRVAHVTIGRESGEVVMIRNTFPQAEPNAIQASITSEEASQKIMTEMNGRTSVPVGEPALVYLPSRDGERLMLAYEMKIKELNPRHTWRYMVDAVTGQIIEKRDLIVHHGSTPQAAASGQVFGKIYQNSPLDTFTSVPMPYVRLEIGGTVVHADGEGRWNLPSATFPLNIKSSLESPFFVVLPANDAPGLLQASVSAGAVNLLWDESNAAASERTAYYAAHKVRSHILNVDPTFDMLDQMMYVNVNVEGECNAFYDPTEQTINFYRETDECSNTAEISDVVYHEYGHHYHHMRNRAAGMDVNSSALGEAVADLVSNFVRNDPVIGRGFRGEGTQLRTSKNTKKWPSGVSEIPHTTGLILSGAIWDLQAKIGIEATETLFHEAMKLAPDAETRDEDAAAALDAFLNMMMAMITVDDDDADFSNGTPNFVAIQQAFEAHGIGISNMLRLGVPPITDQDTLAVSYPVVVNADFVGPVGEVHQDSVKFYYAVGTAPFTAMTLSATGDGNYTGSIPKLPAGTIVKYYVTGRSTIEGATATRYPAGSATHLFLVGFDQKWADDVETESDMNLGVSADNATSGRWERANPMGSQWWDETTMQHDSDHSEFGSYAYVTGNEGQQDFLLNGRTSFETSVLDLSKAGTPVVRFWYYFRSETPWGSSSSYLRLQMQTNGGSWKTIFTTSTSNPKWDVVMVNTGLLPATSSQVKFRWAASAGSSTYVEAGVDDIEILQPPIQQSADVDARASNGISLSTFPNPLTTSDRLNVRYTLPTMTTMQLSLKNVMGRTVWTTNGELKGAGEHSTTIALNELSSGVYWLELNTNMGTELTQVHIVK